jgi:hypothetical protein
MRLFGGDPGYIWPSGFRRFSTDFVGIYISYSALASSRNNADFNEGNNRCYGCHTESDNGELTRFDVFGEAAP